MHKVVSIKLCLLGIISWNNVKSWVSAHKLLLNNWMRSPTNTTRHYNTWSHLQQGEAITIDYGILANLDFCVLQKVYTFRSCRNNFLEQSIQRMNINYSQVWEERNELQRLLSETTKQLKDKVNMIRYTILSTHQ